MKNIVIIGHSSGIGQALSDRLSVSHRIYGTYFKNKPVETHPQVSSAYFNVMDEQSDLSFLPEQIDGLAYCPGLINLKPFHRLTEEDFISDYRLQVTGAVRTIQACLPALKKSGAASIVLFSTVAVQTGFNFHSLVSSSKGAIEGLTRALAAELSPGIRVNCIAPSIMHTPLAQALLNTPEKTEATAQRHPLKRVGRAEDAAHLAAFLLTEESSWMTGQIIHLDGGIGTIK